MAKKVPAYKLELSGDEAATLAIIMNKVQFDGSSAQIIASIQRKMMRAARIYNKSVKAAPESKPKRNKRKSNPGARGKR